jgi:hypothetical protein
VYFLCGLELGFKLISNCCETSTAEGVITDGIQGLNDFSIHLSNHCSREIPYTVGILAFMAQPINRKSNNF